MKYPLKSVFRAPVELWSATTFYVAALVILLWPGYFFIESNVVIGVAIFCFIWASYRAYQAYQIFRAQLNLRPNGIWRLKTEKIPQAKGLLFLGKGYKWTQKHTQTLFDAQGFLQRKGPNAEIHT